MKKIFVIMACLFFIFLAACQAAAPSPALQPSKTPLPPIPSATPILISTPTFVSTGIEPVNITAFCTLIGKDAKTYVPQGTPVIITWGWEAKTELQISDFLINNITTITLDGIKIEGKQSEGIKKNEKSGQPEVVWYSEVGVLDPGEHRITYDVKWKKMIDDGASTYGPGGKNETVHDECQIIVE